MKWLLRLCLVFFGFECYCMERRKERLLNKEGGISVGERRGNETEWFENINI